LLPWAAAPAGLEVHLLDVGHGTACVLRAPGHPAWVFDAGSRDRPGVAEEAVGPLLARWEVTRPSVVLSHPDRDHTGGLERLLLRAPPALWVGALPAEIAERLPEDTVVQDLARGRMLLARPPDGRDGLRLELFRARPGDDNEASRTLVARFAGRTVVLTGDAEVEGLAPLLERGAVPPPVELLLLPHHGAAAGRTAELLRRLAPSRAWAGAAGVPPLAGECARAGVPLSYTARDGPLSLVLEHGEPPDEPPRPLPRPGPARRP
jgi:competence protein ComEC